MDCPTCQIALVPETQQGVAFCACSKCKGLWIEQAQLQQIALAKDKVFKRNDVEAVNRLCGSPGGKKEAAARDLDCPQCKQSKMKTFRYNYSEGVLVDRCAKNCGIWLDADELDKLLIHIELWQDKLEAHQERFEALANQVEAQARRDFDAMSSAADPNRFRFVSALARGLVKLD